MDDLIFYTGNNYLKRSVVYKKTVSLAANGYSFGDIPHNLGYIPAARVYYMVDGKLMEAYGNTSLAANIPAFNGIYATHKIKNNVVSYAITGSGNAARTVTIIAIIYLDDVA